MSSEKRKMPPYPKKEKALTPFRPIHLTQVSRDSLRMVCPLYEEMLWRMLSGILERFQPTSDYPFIDTKIDIDTGADLSQLGTHVDLFGRDTIYAWIQGRGLEALVGHHEWIGTLTHLPVESRQTMQMAMGEMIQIVVSRMEEIRAQNHGHLFFWLDKNGHAFSLNPSGKKIIQDLAPDALTVSDIFYAKGLLAAALFLDDAGMLARAQTYFVNVLHAIGSETLVRDQQSFDPKNPAGEVPGQFTHSARMLGLGGLSLAARHLDDPLYVATGLEFIAHVLDHHVNIDNRFADLEPYDFTEFIDAAGAPYQHHGTILSDSGHACEFVGLALKFLFTVEAKKGFTSTQQIRSDAFKPILRNVLLHNFQLGCNPNGSGIYKNYSLDRREAANSDMPWWNLPETMRAAMLAQRTCVCDDERHAYYDIARKCSNAFLKHYINPDVYWMAYQTIDAQGKPVKVIPATPDLDPGYHTGLSIIDVLDILS